MKTLIKSLAVLSLTLGLSSPAADKTLINYFLPTPIVGSLVTNVWGAPAFSRAIRKMVSKMKP
jgi:hypothetical protein